MRLPAFSAALAVVVMAPFGASAAPAVQLAAVQPAAVRSIESLSGRERATAPDSTPVKVGKLTTTLGALRLEHLSTVARFGAVNPAALRVGANAAILLPSKAVVEPQSGYKDGASDMQAFCNAKKATLCLYYPASTTLWQGGGWASQIDTYITDPAVCAYQNGSMLASGCQYNYPTYYTANFIPGSAGPFTAKVDCDADNWTTPVIDQHGAVAVKTTRPIGHDFTTGPKVSTCLVYVTLK